MKERLQKLLAQANIGSRRASEELISAGRVRVNGATAQLGDKADPATDVIEVDGVRLKFEAQPHLYIMLNKPKQVLSTDKPHRGDRRETVPDLLGRSEHLFSIGRLDADSEGLVVMTNDGDLAQKLSHPRYRHTKTYRVEVLGLPTAETLEKWQRGVTLEDGQTAPCYVEIVKGSPKGTTLRIVMTEGKKRQIRRVAALLGHPVRRLIRTHIGLLALGDLEPGQSRELTVKEVVALSTPSPEIKSLRGQSRRSPAPDGSSESATESRRPRVKTAPASRDEDAAAPRRSSRVKPAADSKTNETSKPRKPRARKSDSHDDKWGKPERPASRDRKPRSRKDRPR